MAFLRRQTDELAPADEPEEWRSRSGLSREWQVGIAFGVTVLVGLICGLAIILPLFRPAPQPTPVGMVAAPDFSVPTAREAYVPAVELIRQTDPAAQLASGAGAWRPTINTTQFEAGRTGWTFHFYLPSTGEMARVVVDRADSAYVAEVNAWHTPPALMNDQAWRIDSPQVIGSLLENCRDVYASTPGAEVETRLTTAAENRTLLWQARVYSAEDPLDVCEVTVDGITGLMR